PLNQLPLTILYREPPALTAWPRRARLKESELLLNGREQTTSQNRHHPTGRQIAFVGNREFGRNLHCRSEAHLTLPQSLRRGLYYWKAAQVCCVLMQSRYHMILSQLFAWELVGWRRNRLV